MSRASRKANRESSQKRNETERIIKKFKERSKT